MGRTCYCCNKDKCSDNHCRCIGLELPEINLTKKEFEISGFKDIDYVGSYTGKFIIRNDFGVPLIFGPQSFIGLNSTYNTKNFGVIGYGDSTVKYVVKTTGLSNFNGSALYKKDTSACLFILNDTSFGSPSFINNATILPIGEVTIESYIDIVMSGKLYTYFPYFFGEYDCVAQCEPFSPCCGNTFCGGDDECSYCAILRQVECPHEADIPSDWNGKIGTKIKCKAFVQIPNSLDINVTCAEGPNRAAIQLLLQVKESEVIADGVYSNYGKKLLKSQGYDMPDACSPYDVSISRVGGIETFKCAAQPCEYLAFERFYDNCKDPFAYHSVTANNYLKFVVMDTTCLASRCPPPPLDPIWGGGSRRYIKRIVRFSDHQNFAPIDPRLLRNYFIFPAFYIDDYNDPTREKYREISNCDTNDDSTVGTIISISYDDCFYSFQQGDSMCSTWDGEKMTSVYPMYVLGFFGGYLEDDPRIDKTNYKKIMACNENDGLDLVCDDAIGAGLYYCYGSRSLDSNVYTRCPPHAAFRFVYGSTYSACKPNYPYSNLTETDDPSFPAKFQNVTVPVPAPFSGADGFYGNWVKDAVSLEYTVNACRKRPLFGPIIPCECTYEELYSKTKAFLPNIDWTSFTSPDDKHIQRIDLKNFSDKIIQPLFVLPKPPEFQLKVTYD